MNFFAFNKGAKRLGAGYQNKTRQNISRLYSATNIIMFVLLALSLTVNPLINPLHAEQDPQKVDVVIMIDLSGSISEDLENPARINDLENEVNSVKAFLDFFKARPNRPRVAIGSFNGRDGEDPTTSARIIPGAELTNKYGSRELSTNLYGVLDSVSKTGGWTDISAAASVGIKHVLDPFSNAKKFVVIITDGIPNRPGLKDYADCKVCGCDNSYLAAESVIEQARRDGVEVITVHYDGNGSQTKCKGEPEGGIEFLRDEVAYLPDHFYQGSLNLAGSFERVQCQIACDDGNACTWDSCDDISGQCKHEPILDDKDQDGIPDCSDKCFGDDALIGTQCSKTLGTCSAIGVYSCGETGSIECSAPVELVQCASCVDEQSVVASTKSTDVSDLVDSLGTLRKKSMRKIKRSDSFDKPAVRKSVRDLRRRGGVFLSEANRLSDYFEDKTSNGLLTTQGVASCFNAPNIERSQLSCRSVYADANLELLVQNVNSLISEIQKAIKVSRKEGGLKKRVRAVRRQLKALRIESVNSLAQIPESYGICS